MPLTFLLLGAAVLSAWAPDVPLPAGRRLAPWLPLLVASTAAGLAQRFVLWPGALAVAMLALLARVATNDRAPSLQGPATALVVLLALALALHRVPGFNNAIVPASQSNMGAVGHDLRLSADKATAGLILLVFFSPRASTVANWSTAMQAALRSTVPTAVVVFGLALAVGYVAWAPKLPPSTLTFLAANLLFTCVAEEAFFRGMVQRWIAARAPSRARAIGAACITAMLFGVAHGAGGFQLVVFATLAGLGYSFAFAISQRIEASILTHIAINALYFLFFTESSVIASAAH